MNCSFKVYLLSFKGVCMINPNLFISVDIDDTETQLEIIKCLYGSKLNAIEINDMLLKVGRIIMLFNNLGLGYDVEKIKEIVLIFDNMDKETYSLWFRLEEGIFSENLSKDGEDEISVFVKLLNKTTKKHLKIVKKKIGKKDYEKTFPPNFEMADVDLVRKALKGLII